MAVIEKVRGVFFSVWGRMAVVEVAADATLDAMQRLCADGGLVDVVVANHHDWWVDDEALIKIGAQPNLLVSNLTGRPLAGNALMLSNDGEGACASVDAGVIERLGAGSVRIAELIGLVDGEEAAYGMEAGVWSVGQVEAMIGEWWPTLDQRLAIDSQGVLIGPPAEVAV